MIFKDFFKSNFLFYDFIWNKFIIVFLGKWMQQWSSQRLKTEPSLTTNDEQNIKAFISNQ